MSATYTSNSQGRNLLVSAALCLLLVLDTIPSAHGSRFFGSSTSPSFGGLPTLRVLPRGQKNEVPSTSLLLTVRGGDEEVLSLDEKVRKAMNKLGLGGGGGAGEPPKVEDPSESPSTTTAEAATTTEAAGTSTEDAPDVPPSSPPPPPPKNEVDVGRPQPKPTKTMEQLDVDVEALADKIADDMNVHPSLAMAALGATSSFETANPTSRQYNEAQARSMIQQELGMMDNVAEDSDEVKQLVSEGYDSFLARRALAFSDMSMEDARAILQADQLDEEEEEREAQQQQQSAAAQNVPAEEEDEAMKSVNVDANFDPTAIGNAKPAALPPANPMPKVARKEDVVFEATTAQIQELVIDSPVPVLLDIYADWCGPCKVLGPALEDMAVKSGGLFRLVKVNSDNERPVGAALEITSLPTVFGIKNGKIENMFMGMPKSEDHMKKFMMGLLMPGGKFDPPVTAKETEKFEELSSKLAKTAGGASFSFAARELLQDRISTRLDALVEAQNGDLVDTEESVQLLRSLLSNIIKAPSEEKFRKVNLANKVISKKIAQHKPCIAILKSVGFAQDGADAMVIGKGKKVVNVAPLTVARDYLDKWIDQTRYDVAKASRKRKDEIALKELEESGALDEVEEEEEEVEEVDPDACALRVRAEGRKKVQNVQMHGDDPISKVIEMFPGFAGHDEEVQITCVSKRLVVKSTDKAAMDKSLRDYGLLPAAALVVKVGAGASGGAVTKGSLAERAAAVKQRKKGSHTMQSIGVYAKDDHLKGEMIDGGGGVMYEQDVTDDEEEEVPEEEETAEGDASSSSAEEVDADETE